MYHHREAHKHYGIKQDVAAVIDTAAIAPISYADTSADYTLFDRSLLNGNEILPTFNAIRVHGIGSEVLFKEHYPLQIYIHGCDRRLL